MAFSAVSFRPGFRREATYDARRRPPDNATRCNRNSRSIAHINVIRWLR